MDTAALVERRVDCFNRHDPEALAACYAPDARVHPAGWPQAVDTGTWLAAVPVIFTTFPDLRLHPRNLAADDRVALLEARMTGTNTGPFPSARPSGCCSAPRPRHCQRPDAPPTSPAWSCSSWLADGSPPSGTTGRWSTASCNSA
jgi:SnoaL-like domain